MLIALAVLCTLIEALFTALEVAMGAVSRARLRALATPVPEEAADGHEPAGAAAMARAKRLLELLERPDRLTVLFLTVTTLSLWMAAALLTLVSLEAHWPPVVLGLVMALVLFAAEVLPLLVAARRAEWVALHGAPIVRFTQRLLAPCLAVFAGSAYGLARIFGAGADATPAVTEGELRSALATAEEEGVIEKEERAMLEGAMDFQDKVVREVMTPRIDIVAVSAQTCVSEALETALKSGHSRLPVFEGTLDKVTGIAATKDFLPHLRSGEAGNISAGSVARPVFYVPENQPISNTLDELRKQRTLLAMVVDADGGTAGLVTLEDLLEELVGEIQDEYDVEEPPLQFIESEPGQVTVRCQAGVTARELVRFLERELHLNATLKDGDEEPVDASQSLAAVALDLFESVPAAGDTIVIGEAVSTTADIKATFRLQLEVSQMEGPRIEEVCIRLLA